MHNYQQLIRNFCIIAHIDAGKSTLADRMLEFTETVPKNKMVAQLLDKMELERERGITIKMAPVRMIWRVPNHAENSSTNPPAGGQKSNKLNNEKCEMKNVQSSSGYILNLIDTPGHVDFSYEVSRALAAVEGAILLVDAAKGVQAQTLANWQLAKKQGLAIIPAINKIDLPAADANRTESQIAEIIGIAKKDIYYISAKTGEGVEDLFEAIVNKILPPNSRVNPRNDPRLSVFKALVFDSIYDVHRGVVAHVRVIEGEIKKGEQIIFVGSKATDKSLEVGVFSPEMQAADSLSAGDIGYIVTGLKSVGEARVGDTISKLSDRSAPLPGYKKIKPMVYANLFPSEGEDTGALKKALEKLKLNDASLEFSPFHSPILGFGFRCGFNGILHLDISKERLKREFAIETVVTPPSVVYKIKKPGQDELIDIFHPSELPQGVKVDFFEPWAKIEIIVPFQYYGQIIKILEEKRGEFNKKAGFSPVSSGIMIINYLLPLAEVITDLNDLIKTATSGYGSLAYNFGEYRQSDLQKLDIVVNDEVLPMLSQIIARQSIEKKARALVDKLSGAIPRQMIEVKIQARVDARILASSRISPLRKDVTAKLYGGDVTRKKKLLEKQKKGKAKMRQMGKVQVPSDIFLKII